MSASVWPQIFSPSLVGTLQWWWRGTYTPPLQGSILWLEVAISNFNPSRDVKSPWQCLRCAQMCKSPLAGWSRTPNLGTYNNTPFKIFWNIYYLFDCTSWHAAAEFPWLGVEPTFRGGDCPRVWLTGDWPKVYWQHQVTLWSQKCDEWGDESLQLSRLSHLYPFVASQLQTRSASDLPNHTQNTLLHIVVHHTSLCQQKST